MAVRLAGYISRESNVPEMALGFMDQSLNGNYRRLSCIVARAYSIQLDFYHDFGGDYFGVLVYSAYEFRRMERTFADIV